jgi:hypothetical protein
MFTLASVVPWGRSFDEYRRMFALSDADLAGRILGCGDGPASFNVAATQRGASVVSCDPLYRFDATPIRTRIDQTRIEVLEQARRNAHEFVWDDAIPDVDALERVRMSAMTAFLDDYEQGRSEGRYLDAELPSLPFADDAFDLALCSHFLVSLQPAARRGVSRGIDARAVPGCARGPGVPAAGAGRAAVAACGRRARGARRRWLGDLDRACAVRVPARWQRDAAGAAGVMIHRLWRA